MFKVDPETHRVRDTEAARFLRRELREPTVFTYWHAESGNWCLGYWVDKQKGLADYLMEVGSVFDNGPILTEEAVFQLKCQHRRPDFQAQRRKIVQSERQEFNRMDDQRREYQDQRHYYKKRTGQDFLFQ